MVLTALVVGFLAGFITALALVFWRVARAFT